MTLELTLEQKNSRQRRRQPASKRSRPSVPRSARPNAPATKPLHSKSNRPRPPKKRRRGNRVLHYILFFAIIVILGTTLTLTVFFKIQDIIVIGVEHYEPQKVAEATGIALGDNLFLANTKQAEVLLLSAFPYIEEVTVRRTFPSAIEVHAVPSLAIAALEQSANNYILITYQGKVLERGLALLPHDSILVKGVALDNMNPGNVLGEYTLEPAGKGESTEARDARRARNTEIEVAAAEQEEILRMLHFFLAAMEETKFTDITNIDLSNRHNMEIMYENRILLRLGSETDLAYKLEFAKQILTKELPSQAVGTLDLAEVRRNRVYFRYPEGYTEDGIPKEDVFLPNDSTVSLGDSEDNSNSGE